MRNYNKVFLDCMKVRVFYTLVPKVALFIKSVIFYRFYTVNVQQKIIFASKSLCLKYI